MIELPDVQKARRRARFVGCAAASVAGLGVYALLFIPLAPLLIACIVVVVAAASYVVWLFLIHGLTLLKEVERNILERHKRKSDWVRNTSIPDTQDTREVEN